MLFLFFLIGFLYGQDAQLESSFTVQGTIIEESALIQTTFPALNPINLFDIRIKNKIKNKQILDTLLEGIDPVNTADVVHALLRWHEKDHQKFVDSVKIFQEFIAKKLLLIVYLSHIDVRNIDTFTGHFYYFLSNLQSDSAVQILAQLLLLKTKELDLFRTAFQTLSIGRSTEIKKQIFSCLLNFAPPLMNDVANCLQRIFPDPVQDNDVIALKVMSMYPIDSNLLQNLPNYVKVINEFIREESIQTVFEWALQIEIDKDMLETLLVRIKTEDTIIVPCKDLKIATFMALKGVKNIQNKKKLGRIVRELFDDDYYAYFFGRSICYDGFKRMIRCVAACPFNDKLQFYLSKFRHVCYSQRDYCQIIDILSTIPEDQVNLYLDFAIPIVAGWRLPSMVEGLKTLIKIQSKDYKKFTDIAELFFKNKILDSDKCFYLILLSHIPSKFYTFFYNFYQHNDGFFFYTDLYKFNEQLLCTSFKSEYDVKNMLIKLHEDNKHKLKNPNIKLIFNW